jgi:hypothetical protein
MEEAAQAGESLTFYLGTHEPGWLARLAVPLCVSRTRLQHRKTLPRAIIPWMLDSGSFTELERHREHTMTPAGYAAFVRRCRDQIGQLAWAAPQDWMCEPFMLARTGLTVAGHQQRTVENYLELRMAGDGLPIRPVLQGWTRDDYLRCVDLYASYGVDLEGEPLVGLGSVCRRQDTDEAGRIVRALAPLRLHGFGVKVTGLREFGYRLISADSLAWSYNARRNPPMHGCTHRSCANCPRRAVWWRGRLLASLSSRGWQEPLFDLEDVS